MPGNHDAHTAPAAEMSRKPGRSKRRTCALLRVSVDSQRAEMKMAMSPTGMLIRKSQCQLVMERTMPPSTARKSSRPVIQQRRPQSAPLPSRSRDDDGQCQQISDGDPLRRGLAHMEGIHQRRYADGNDRRIQRGHERAKMMAVSSLFMLASGWERKECVNICFMLTHLLLFASFIKKAAGVSAQQPYYPFLGSMV